MPLRQRVIIIFAPWIRGGGRAMSQNMKCIIFIFYFSKGLVLECFWPMCGFEGIVALLDRRSWFCFLFAAQWQWSVARRWSVPQRSNLAGPESTIRHLQDESWNIADYVTVAFCVTAQKTLTLAPGWLRLPKVHSFLICIFMPLHFFRFCTLA